MNEDTFAARLFQAERTYTMLDSELYDQVIRIFGIDAERQWPFEDITNDYYDSSFEIKLAQPELDPTEEQRKEFWALGFERFWICYVDGTEKHWVNPDYVERVRTITKEMEDRRLLREIFGERKK